MGMVFGVTVFLSTLITAFSVSALHSVISSNDLNAFNHAQALRDAERLRTVAHQKVSIGRGFLLTRDSQFFLKARQLDEEFRTRYSRLKERAEPFASSTNDRDFLLRTEEAQHIYERAFQRAMRIAKSSRGDQRKLVSYFDRTVMPRFDDWDRSLRDYSKAKEKQLADSRIAAHDAASRAMRLILIIGSAALILTIILGVIFTRTMSRLYEELRLAVRAREDVLAIVSHDLRNPLSAVMLNADMLVRTPEIELEKRKRMLRTIQTSSRQMRQLITDVMDFVKVESGKVSINKKAEDTCEILDDLLSVFSPLARDKGLSIDHSVAPEARWINCDRGRVLQVLSNLIGNAIKFTPPGGTLRVDASVQAGEALFKVSDTGIGIPASQLTCIFDQYWQAKRESKQGIGLGLSIAKELVDAHGGRIWVESEPERGTQFFFTLPLAATHRGAGVVPEGLTTRKDAAAKRGIK